MYAQLCVGTLDSQHPISVPLSGEISYKELKVGQRELESGNA